MALTKVTYAMIEGSPVNVVDFGATGNGVDDDTAAIQAALDSIPATAVGNTLFFPAGTFKITSNISSTNKSVSYVGSGVATTVIACAGLTAGITFNGGNNTAQADIRQLNMRDLTIRKTYAPTGAESGGSAVKCIWTETGIQAGFDHARFVNVSIMPTDETTFWNKGLEIQDGGAIYLANVNIANWGSRGAIGNDTTAALYINRIVASNCDRFYIVNSYFHRFLNGIMLDQANAVQVGSIEGIYIANSEIVACDTGIKTTEGANTNDYVNGLQFTNGHIDCQSYGIDAWFVASSIISNSFIIKGVNGGTGVDSALINVGYRADGFSVNNNNLVKFPSVATVTNGIVTPGGLNTFKVRIVGNTFETLDTGVSVVTPIPYTGYNPNYVSGVTNQFVNCTLDYDEFLVENTPRTSGVNLVASGDTITFPWIMTNPNVVAVAQGTTTTVNVTVDAVTATNFRIYHNAGGTINVQWIAASNGGG